MFGFLPPRICCLVCEGFSTNAAVYFCALNNGTQTEESKALIPKLGEKMCPFGPNLVLFFFLFFFFHINMYQWHLTKRYSDIAMY